jgi:hypothetical protein
VLDSTNRKIGRAAETQVMEGDQHKEVFTAHR